MFDNLKQSRCNCKNKDGELKCNCEKGEVHRCSDGKNRNFTNCRKVCQNGLSQKNAQNNVFSPQILVENSVVIGKNAIIQPFCVILGNSVIGENAVIGSFSYLENAVVGENSTVISSRIVNSQIGKKCTVGPFSHLRNETVVDDECRIGNFVEIKKSHIGNKTKSSHLTYIGDADVGENTNIGCGVIFVNYDGKVKHKTEVGNNCFIGCNSNLVAPLIIDDGCFVACGTTVTDNLSKDDFVIGRAKMTVKPNRAKKYLKK